MSREIFNQQFEAPFDKNQGGLPNSSETGTIAEIVNPLVEAARVDALSRLSPDLHPQQRHEAEYRIGNGIERRLRPYVAENEIITRQLSTPEYATFIEEVDTFLDAKVGFIVCPDGRIISLALGDPRVANTHRRLQGLPETRSSTQTNDPVLDDPDLAAHITTALEDRIDNEKNAELVEFVGPHIHSEHPDHGCGAATAKVRSHGKSARVGMRYGSIAEYFEELGEGFYAFNSVAERAGGQGTTFDLTHDAYSQGFIVGLRNEYKNFKSQSSLRENLLNLANDGKILMTELLDDAFRQSIEDEAKKLLQTDTTPELDLSDPEKFSFNAMLIGRVAKTITMQEQERNNFGWIPDAIRDGKSEKATKVLAYHAIRNSVYRVLGSIIPGHHRLTRHPEKIIVVGTIGAEFNVDNIPFIETTPRGPLRDSDLDAVEKLYGLSEGILQEQGVQLEAEGRVIMVTGIYDPNRYASPQIARAAFNEIASTVRNNAARLRERYSDSIQTGEVIVTASLHEPKTRRITHILTNKPNGKKTDLN